MSSLGLCTSLDVGVYCVGRSGCLEEDIYGRSRVHGIWSSRSQKEPHLHLDTRRLYCLCFY
jgi:hypothetical protein